MTNPTLYTLLAIAALALTGASVAMANALDAVTADIVLPSKP